MPTVTDPDIDLWNAHRAELEASAISPKVISARGYRSITNPKALPPAFSSYQRRAGLLIPICNPLGNVSTYQLKPDHPRIDDAGRVVKYETAVHGRTCIDVPAASLPYLDRADVPLWITEGCKKVDSAVSHGQPCIVGLLGVDAWSSQGMALPDWKDIALKGRDVVIAFDSDVMRKESVRGALERLARYLEYREAHLTYLVLPDQPDGGKCGLDDWYAAGRDRIDLDPLIAGKLPGSVTDWDPPVPLDPTTGPPFSIESMPEVMGRYVDAVAEEMQTPLDLPALVAIGTLSAAAGGKYEVLYEPATWREPAHVMVTPVAESANNKGGVFRKVVRPVRTWEAERQEADLPRIAEWESKHRRLEKQLQRAETDVGKSDGKRLSDGEAVRMAAVDEVQRHLKERPVLTEVFTDDATPEAVKQMLAEQGGAVAVMSAESAYLSNVAGRYHDAPHLDTILNGHAGDLVKVKRKGKPTEHVERAYLTMCLMLQPEVIEELSKVAGFRQRGGAARLLPAFPADMIGRRKLRTTPVPAALDAAWEDLVRTVLEVRRTEPPCTLTLSAEAEAMFTRFRAWWEPHIKAEG